MHAENLKNKALQKGGGGRIKSVLCFLYLVKSSRELFLCHREGRVEENYASLPYGEKVSSLSHQLKERKLEVWQRAVSYLYG